MPDEAISCGFTEAVRGVLSHHMVIRDGKIANYHPYPPTPWNGSVRDTYGTPGPYEDAVQNTPIFEENPPDKFKGIDIMRAVRSFDPCLPCGVHMYLGNGKVLKTAALADRCPRQAWADLELLGRHDSRRSGADRVLLDEIRAADPARRRGRRGAGPRWWSSCTAPASSDCWSWLGRAAGSSGWSGTTWSPACWSSTASTPTTSQTRIQAALDSVRPYLGSHAGGVELLGIDADGVVHLRLQGSCDGCPSTATVRLTVERRRPGAAPEVVARRGRGHGQGEAEPADHRAAPPAPGRLAPARTLEPHPPTRSRHRPVAGVDVLAAGLAGRSTPTATAARPVPRSLRAGPGRRPARLPRCAAEYDVRLAGRARRPRADRHSSPLPLLPEGAGWKVAIPGVQPA